MKVRKIDVAFNVRLIIREVENETEFTIFDQYELCFTEKEIIESSGFFHENLIHFLENRIFLRKKRS